MGLLDAFNAQPGSAEALQLQGLLGGLTRMGGLLAQAGQFRPAGTPGPGIGDAFLGFGEGQRAGVQNAAQQAQMARKQAQAAMIAKAQSATPDAELSPPEMALRSAWAKMPEGLKGLAGAMDTEQFLNLGVQHQVGRQRIMTPEELRAGGHPDGSVVYVNDFTGAPNVVRQSQLKTEAEMAQHLRGIAAGRAPTVRWTTIRGPDGQPIAQESTSGEYRPLRDPQKPPEGMRWNGSGGLELIPGYDTARARLAEVAQPSRGGAPEGMQYVDGALVPIPGYAANKPAVVAAGQPPQRAPEGMRWRADGQLENIPGYIGAKTEVSAIDDPKRRAAAADDLRGEFTKLTADFRTVQDAFNKIEMAGKTGQGDLALLYGYMKILDPTSVVRESEFATAAKSGSFGEQMQGLVTKVLNGERLPDTVREGFKNEARNVYQAQSKSYLNLHNTYRDLALRQGAKPEDVVLPFKMDGTGSGGSGLGGGGSFNNYLDLKIK